MTRMFILITVIQHSVGSPSLSDQTTQRNKRHPKWQGERQNFTLHRQHDTLCGKPKRLKKTKNQKPKQQQQQKTLLELIHEFSKVAGYKINVQKLVAFLTPIMKQQKEKSRNRSHLQLHQNHKIPSNKSHPRGKRSVL